MASWIACISVCFIITLNLTEISAGGEDVKAVFSVQLDTQQPLAEEPVKFSWNLVDTLKG